MRQKSLTYGSIVMFVIILVLAVLLSMLRSQSGGTATGAAADRPGCHTV